MRATKIVRVKLMAEYLCRPLWTYDEAGVARNVGPHDLPLPPGLAWHIEQWDGRLQATFDGAHPFASGFETDGELEDHRKEGAALGEELAEALAGMVPVIEFEPTGERRSPAADDDDGFDLTLVRKRRNDTMTEELTLDQRLAS